MLFPVLSALEEVFINLKSLARNAVSLHLYNQFGQEVLEKNRSTLTKETIRLNLSGLSNEVYILQI